MSGRRPAIGLTGNTGFGNQIGGFPAAFADLSVDVHIGAYSAAIFAAGGLPLLLPVGVDVGAYAGRLDGVLITGGADIDPSRYGASADAHLGDTEPQRDAMELALVDLADSERLPTLGICRGLQLLNVRGGGSLHQHVPAQARLDLPIDTEVDDVVFTAGSRMHELYGDRRRVNSLHHQAVDRIAAGWVATGRNHADAGVEAIERPGADMVAVQWHPELLAGAATDPLFRWLVDAANGLAAPTTVSS